MKNPYDKILLLDSIDIDYDAFRLELNVKAGERERTLYLAVILQALLDLSKPKIKNEDNSIQLYRDQAHAWVFKDVGVTCQDFEEVCYYAGLEPSVIRNFASNVINSEDTTNVRRKFQALL